MSERKVPVQFYLSEQEHEVLLERMKLFGIMNKSAFIRKMALSGYMLQLDIPELKDIIRLLRYAGNNLNQLARKANTGATIYEEEMKDIKSRFGGLTGELNRLVKELGKIC
jgi:hypothetical protein